MLMTIDGTNDDLIRIDGVEKYTFTDADAGDLPANEASDDDNEQDEEEQGRAGGAVALDDSDGDDEEGEEARTTPLMTIWRMIQLIPSNCCDLLVQRRLRQVIRFSNRRRG